MHTVLPFVIAGVLIFHFKLLLQGPHKDVHFLWKQPVLDEKYNPQQTKLICGLCNKKELYYTRSMKREIRLKLGIVKPNQATCVIKDLRGDKSAAENENQREVLQRLQTVVSAREEIIVDLRKNNGLKPKYDEFCDVVADHISEKTAVDDRRHSASSTKEQNVVVVNMASLPYADMYKTCIQIAQEKNINAVPSYLWFMLQFWPTSKSTSKLLHYTGRFCVRRVVQAYILRKTNPDADYARAVYNLLKKCSINTMQMLSFLVLMPNVKYPSENPVSP